MPCHDPWTGKPVQPHAHKTLDGIEADLRTLSHLSKTMHDLAPRVKARADERHTYFEPNLPEADVAALKRLLVRTIGKLAEFHDAMERCVRGEGPPRQPALAVEEVADAS